MYSQGWSVTAGYFSYRDLGSDLLPEMDEGAFVLDYFTPAGTSLTETNRILEHVDQILRRIPEVSVTSRRTGLQMGLAAVTEANTGDFTVRLKPERSRSIDEVIADAREQIHAAEPSLYMEFTQILQDMIGDLSNSPEPVQIKLFSNDQNLLLTLGPRVQQAIAKIPGIVDTENGVDNTISGPATNFQIDPVVAARLGFTPTEIAEDATAILDGLPANNPLIAGGRPYTIRVRLPENNRASLDAIENTVFNSSSGHTATLSAMATVTQLPPQNEIRRENLQQVVMVSGRLEGSDLGGAMEQVKAAVSRLQLPGSVRVEYGGTYQEQQRSFADLARVLVLALGLVLGVLLAEFRNFAAPVSILTSSVLSLAGVVFALLLTGTGFNVASFMGLIMVIGIVAKNGILLIDADEQLRAGGMDARRGYDPRRAAAQAAHSYDGHRNRLRNVSSGASPGRGLADAATAGHRGHWRSYNFHRAQPGGYAGGVLSPGSASPGGGITNLLPDELSIFIVAFARVCSYLELIPHSLTVETIRGERLHCRSAALLVNCALLFGAGL